MKSTLIACLHFYRKGFMKLWAGNISGERYTPHGTLSLDTRMLQVAFGSVARVFFKKAYNACTTAADSIDGLRAAS